MKKQLKIESTTVQKIDIPVCIYKINYYQRIRHSYNNDTWKIWKIIDHTRIRVCFEI